MSLPRLGPLEIFAIVIDDGSVTRAGRYGPPDGVRLSFPNINRFAVDGHFPFGISY